METLKDTIDADADLATIVDAITDIEARIDELEAEALDLADNGEDGGDRWQEISRIVDDYEALLVDLRSRKRVLERALDEWEGSEITVRELTGTETRMLKDELRREARQAGVDVLPEGAHETRFLETAVESTPPGCPDPEDIGDLPDRMFEWLLARTNALNTVGEFQMGNSSLSERVAERRSRT